MIELDPPPVDMADLLIAMTETTWPTTDADRVRFFDQFGIQPSDEKRSPTHDLPDTVWIPFGLGSFHNVEGSSVMFRDEFVDITLFCYGEHGGQGRMAYRALQDELSQRLGPTEEEWGSPGEPACMWLVGALMLEIYCFQTPHSSLMVGLTHAARSDQFDRLSQSG